MADQEQKILKAKGNQIGTGYSDMHDPASEFSAKTDSFIEIYHLLTQQTLTFTAYIKNFSDDHQSTWTDESVYGRMDDITTFANTKRFISIDFDVPSIDTNDAIVNMQKISLLKQFLYPAYGRSNHALALSSSPLVRLKFINFVYNPAIPSTGLLGRLKNINFAPNEEAGYHYVGSLEKDKKNTVAIPKVFSINISQFGVLHEHQLGWIKEGDKYKFAGTDTGKVYPFSLNTTDEVQAPDVVSIFNSGNIGPSAEMKAKIENALLAPPVIYSKPK